MDDQQVAPPTWSSHISTYSFVLTKVFSLSLFYWGLAPFYFVETNTITCQELHIFISPLDTSPGGKDTLRIFNFGQNLEALNTVTIIVHITTTTPPPPTTSTTAKLVKTCFKIAVRTGVEIGLNKHCTGLQKGPFTNDNTQWRGRGKVWQRMFKLVPRHL